MTDAILKAAKSDVQLAILLGEVKEYAQIYLLAKQRQKGCDEMGEVETLKDEFRCAIDKLVEFCKDKRYINEDFSYDINTIADEIRK